MRSSIPPFQYLKSCDLICFKAGKESQPPPPDFLSLWQAAIAIVSTDHLQLLAFLTPHPILHLGVPHLHLVTHLNRRTDRILKIQGTIPPLYSVLVDFIIVSCLVLYYFKEAAENLKEIMKKSTKRLQEQGKMKGNELFHWGINSYWMTSLSSSMLRVIMGRTLFCTNKEKIDWNWLPGRRLGNIWS